MNNEPERTDDSESVAAPEAAPTRLALPPPDEPSPLQAGPGVFDRLISLIEMRPILSTATIFAALVVIHVLILNLAGIAEGLFVESVFFALAGNGLVELLLLAFIAYNVTLPTFLARSCLISFADSAPALACNDSVYDQCLENLANPHAVVRLVFGFFWAAILTPVFGSLFQSATAGTAANAALLAIWMYIRLALIFGLLGSTMTYIAMLHYRFAAVTGAHLRVDLFDMTPLQPLARYVASATLYLAVLLALVGPVISRPEASTASGILLALGMTLIVFTTMGALWGARGVIRATKQLAFTELQAYAREIWRRAYTNGRIVEAVALPAMAAMLTVRREISWLSDWPGGWPNIIRLITLSLIPIATWFGGQILAFLIATLVP